MELTIAKYAAVVLLAASPVGELLVAIPTGVALGLNPVVVLAMVLVANYLPAQAIDLAFSLAQRHPRLVQLLQKFARPGVTRLLNRYGLLGVLVATPWVGVYTMVVALRLLGMGRVRLLAGVGVSLLLYGVVVAILATLGKELISSLR